MNEEQKKKVKEFLNEVYKATYYDQVGESVHPCEYYSTRQVKRVAEILGIELGDEELDELNALEND